MKSLFSKDTIVGLENAEAILNSKREEIEYASVEYAFYSFFLNYVLKNEKALEVAQSMQKDFSEAQARFKENGSKDYIVFYKLLTFMHFASNVIIRDAIENNKQDSYKETYIGFGRIFISCTNEMSQLPSQNDGEQYKKTLKAIFAEKLPVFCNVLGIDTPTKETLLSKFFVNQLNREALDVSLPMLSLEDPVADVVEKYEESNTAVANLGHTVLEEEKYLKGMPSIILRKPDVFPLLAPGDKDTVADSIAKASLILSKVSSHLDNAPVVFLGRAADLISRAYPLASTYLGNTSQRSFDVSFTGTPGLVNRRGNVDGKSVTERTKNYVDEKHVKFFFQYLDSIGMGEVDMKKPIIICDMANSTGYGLRRFVDFLESYFKDHKKKKPPECIFASFDRHFMPMRKEGSLVELKLTGVKKGLEAKFGLEVVFNNHPEDSRAMAVRRMFAITLGMPCFVSELMDNDIFESLFAKNIYFPACRWLMPNVNADLEKGAEYSKSKEYSDVVQEMLQSSVKRICDSLVPQSGAVSSTSRG